ncbi:hypothetical protein ABOZ73_15475 [Caulobacter sp. 73W]|uniref:Dihydrodipicolinate reductase N-terminal domain-containing protein n=1 Tax=Caulobacter sp. 73W TaxID=3161137 RepID=A0AB39KRC4_9CAUL
MYRVIQWATGAMGRTALRRIIDHPDLELVGVYVYSDDKAGADAGDLAKRPKTGVIATNRIEDILALDADVVIHTPRITLPYDALNDDVARLLASGKNVISTAGFHWPTHQGGAYAAPLLEACRAGNATLAGLGVNPGALVERIVLSATGLCAQLDHITVREMVDARAMAQPVFVYDFMGFAKDPTKEDITQGPLAKLYTSLFGEVFAAVAHAMDATIEDLSPDHRLTLAPHDMAVAAGPIPKGTVAATEWRWNARFSNGAGMTLSILWTADPALHGANVTGHWTVDIEGRPNISLTLDIHEGDPKAPPARALTDATVAVAIRAIPDICAAAPGFFAYDAPAPYRARL